MHIISARAYLSLRSLRMCSQHRVTELLHSGLIFNASAPHGNDVQSLLSPVLNVAVAFVLALSLVTSKCNRFYLLAITQVETIVRRVFRILVGQVAFHTICDKTANFETSRYE